MTAQGSSFWTRRRAAVLAEQEAEAARASESAAQAEQAALAELTDEEILEELGLPEPESLALGDDFTAFMAKAVPQHLRNRALRVLWRSNPVLACVDGLNDYDDDYLTGSTGNAPIKTAYQVGKGMLAHIEKLAEDALKKEAAEEAPLAVAVAEPEDVAEQEPDAETDIAFAEADETASDADAQDDAPDEDAAIPTPRRMQFTFANEASV